jgi:hypothetical protein
MAGYTAAVQKYQIQLQQQQQQQDATISTAPSASSTRDRKLLQTGGRAPTFSPEFIAAYTAAVQKYQLQLQQQQQQQASVSSMHPSEASADGRKLLQTGGRSPSYSADFVAAYTAAVQQYQAQLQLQQQQQQSVAAASAAKASVDADADAGRKLLQTGGRTPSFSPEFIAAYTAAVQKYQLQLQQQQQQQQQQQATAASNVVDGGRKLQQTGARSPAYNEAFTAGYTAAVRQYQAMLLQQKQQQQQAAAVAAESKPVGNSGRNL